MQNDQLFLFLKNFLSKLNFKINASELRFQLLSHPYYPSLNSVVGVLNHFGVNNYPIQIDETPANLNDLPMRFITKTKESNAFVMVTKKGETTIELTYEDTTHKKLKIHEFLEIWDGKVLIVEKLTKKVGSNKGTKPALIALSLGTLILLGLIFWNLENTLERIHFISTLLGLFVSILIINKQFGGMSPLLDKVCHFTSMTDCDRVINSKEISLPYNVELGDLAIIYFGSNLLFWIVSVIIDIDTSILFYLAILSIPITLLSIYYQKLIIEKWCTLCLAIVGILWLQFGVFSINNNLWNFNVWPDLNSILFLVIILIYLIIIWSFVKNFISSYIELATDKIKYYKFKSNFELFILAYNSASRLMDGGSLEAYNEIKIGNPASKTQIVMITNPTCSYCKSAYPVLRTAVERFPEHVGLTIRFSADTKNTDSLGYRIAKQLTALYEKIPKKQVAPVLDILRGSQKEMLNWLEESPKVEELTLEKADMLLEKQKEWCTKNQIFFTPYVLINGAPLPKQYDISDLPLVLSDFIDLQNMELQLAV